MHNEFQDKIVCPVCQYENTHIRSVEHKNNPGDYKNWIGKSDAVYIKMHCEEEHDFSIVIGEHKGVCYIFTQTEKTIKIPSQISIVTMK